MFEQNSLKAIKRGEIDIVIMKYLFELGFRTEKGEIWEKDNLFFSIYECRLTSKAKVSIRFFFDAEEKNLIDSINYVFEFLNEIKNYDYVPDAKCFNSMNIDVSNCSFFQSTDTNTEYRLAEIKYFNLLYLSQDNIGKTILRESMIEFWLDNGKYRFDGKLPRDYASNTNIIKLNEIYHPCEFISHYAM